MNTIAKITLQHAICASLFLFASCTNSNNNHDKDSKEQAEDMNEEKFDRKGEKDADRLVEAYCGNLYEIRASENAASKATTADVKKLAAMIAMDHTKMNADLQSLASSKNITLPTDITDDQRKKLENLAEKSGLDYDKEYTSQMKDKHEDGVKAYEKTADNAEDAEIKQWASTTLPQIRSHLDMVKATDDKIKEMKDADKDRKTDKNTWDDKSGMHDGKDNVHEKKHS